MDDQGHRELEVTTPSDPEGDDLLERSALPALGLGPAVLVAIFVGGALGTVARYLLETRHPAGSTGFPWVTLGVNLSGSFAIGAGLVGCERLSGRWALVRPALVVGFLGGWTTYSTLAVESVVLGVHDRAGAAALYLGATLVGGTALVAAGHGLGRRLWAR
jgi:CrcB protein